MERKIEEQLLAWKNKTDDRLPLIVNGARQVGKTYIIRYVGDKLFENYIEINMAADSLGDIIFFDSDSGEKKLQF